MDLGLKNKNVLVFGSSAGLGKAVAIEFINEYRQFCESQIGQQSNVLFERRNQDNYFEGYTENFIKVEMNSDKDLSNQILHAQLKEISIDRVKVETTL